MASFKAAHSLSLAGGLLVLLLTLFGQSSEPPRPCGNLSASYAPIIAFEMARSVDDLHALFGSTQGECRDAMVAQMNRINWIDCFAYIPSYGALLFFFCLGMRRFAARLAVFAAWLVLAACFADYLENACLFKLASNPDVSSIWLTLLVPFTFTKWIALGAVSALVGLIIARQARWQSLLFFVFIPALLISLWAAVDPAHAGPILSLAFAPGWIAMLIYDVIVLIKARRATASN